MTQGRVVVRLVLALLALAVLGLNSTGRAHGQDGPDGKHLFRAHCAACHAIEPGQVTAIPGPDLAGIYGRAAGSLPDYPYSPALAGAGFVWNAAKLDAWLADPQAVRPGTTMRYRVSDPAIRLRIIAWLQAHS